MCTTSGPNSLPYHTTTPPPPFPQELGVLWAVFFGAFLWGLAQRTKHEQHLIQDSYHLYMVRTRCLSLLIPFAACADAYTALTISICSGSFKLGRDAHAPIIERQVTVFSLTSYVCLLVQTDKLFKTSPDILFDFCKICLFFVFMFFLPEKGVILGPGT